VEARETREIGCHRGRWVRQEGAPRHSWREKRNAKAAAMVSDRGCPTDAAGQEGGGKSAQRHLAGSQGMQTGVPVGGAACTVQRRPESANENELGNGAGGSGLAGSVLASKAGSPNSVTGKQVQRSDSTRGLQALWRTQRRDPRVCGLTFSPIDEWGGDNVPNSASGEGWSGPMGDRM